MSDKFITPCALPTPHECELLTIFIEECAEAQQRATKALRFGLDEIQPGQPLTNRERLGFEIGDVEQMVAMLREARCVRGNTIQEGRERKRQKLAKYMQTKAPEDSR